MFSINSLFKFGFINKDTQNKKTEFVGTNLKPLRKDTVSFGSSMNVRKNPLDRYTKYNTAISNALIPIRVLDLLTFKEYKGKNSLHSAWKMHIYANNEQDMFDLQNSVGQYLIDNGINWKTTIDYSRLKKMSEDEQKGKAITIYPESIEAFKKIARDIDYIIKHNGLETEDTSIQGDRQLGDSGRIFYRYEYNSGKFKDRIFDLEREYDEYHSIYEGNRGDNNYLAADMTPNDDPFLNFNPSSITINNKTTKLLKDCPIEGNKYRLIKNEIFPLKSNIVTVFDTGNQQTDFKINVKTDAKIRRMQNGDTLTIGRAPDNDIVIGENENRISRHHAKIYKANDKLYIEDTSMNGTRVNE